MRKKCFTKEDMKSLKIYKDIAGVETDIDAILVWGRTLKEHDERLKATLGRARQCNLKLKLEKFHFIKKSVVYIGHQLTQKGVKPDPQYIEAIVNIPQPEDKKGFSKAYLYGQLCRKNRTKFIGNHFTFTTVI